MYMYVPIATALARQAPQKGPQKKTECPQDIYYAQSAY